jgi:hypothetical protein
MEGKTYNAESGAESQLRHEDGGSGHLLQTIITSATIGVAVLYAVGMMVTNEYLFTIGYSDFNLIRPKCIITGTWAILVVVLLSRLTGLRTARLQASDWRKKLLWASSLHLACA